MKTRKKANRVKHQASVAAASKRLAKEGADRVRLGKPRYPGDDRCKDKRGEYVCDRPAGHGGDHDGVHVGSLKRKRWKA